LQPVDRERIIPWVYDASIHAIALGERTGRTHDFQKAFTAKAQRTQSAAKEFFAPILGGCSIDQNPTKRLTQTYFSPFLAPYLAQKPASLPFLVFFAALCAFAPLR
jgi:hypothetical protein